MGVIIESGPLLLLWHVGQGLMCGLNGDSVTLSNLGPHGVDQLQTIIVPRQSGILAIGAIKLRPFVVEEKLTLCQTLFLTLSVDHRVVDGADAARFLDHLVQVIERPLLLCAL